MTFLGSASELVKEMMGLSDGDPFSDDDFVYQASKLSKPPVSTTPTSKRSSPPKKKEEKPQRVVMVSVMDEELKEKERQKQRQMEEERKEEEKEEEFELVFTPINNCPNCSQIVPRPTKKPALTFEKLHPQLQLTCSSCSTTFCTICTETSTTHAPTPCYTSCCYIAFRIIQHLTKLILSYNIKVTNTASNYMPKGTGYGTGSSSAPINPLLFKEKTKKVDSHVTKLMLTMAKCVAMAQQSGVPLTEGLGSFPSMHTILCCSKFEAIISYFLRNDSFFDMTERGDLYRTLFQLVDLLCTDEILKSQLLIKQKKGSVSNLLENMNSKVTILLSSKHLQGDQRIMDLCSMVSKLFSALRKREQEKKVAEEKEEEKNTTPATAADADAAAATTTTTATTAAATITTTTTTTTTLSSYVDMMQDHQFGELEMKGVPPFVHHYASQASPSSLTNLMRSQRICLELQNLCSPDFLSEQGKTGILVRFDPNSLGLMRVMITGPPGTPYAFGCFIFDIFLPSSYPGQPPLVWLMTTGHGSVRFNPNLYNCGKVCLSLLGTWSGGVEEKWNPAVSTIAQVLLSLQSMVLVSEPYFNEPGYQSTYGTEHGKRASDSYNTNIERSTMKFAILEHLKVPPYGFEEATKAHIMCNRQAILQLMQVKSPELVAEFKALLNI